MRFLKFGKPKTLWNCRLWNSLASYIERGITLFYRVQSVETKDNFVLSVLFTDGVITEYDVKPLFLKWDVFNNLKTINGLFQQVKVDAGGFGISWNDEIDLASEELRINGKEKKN